MKKLYQATIEATISATSARNAKYQLQELDGCEVVDHWAVGEALELGSDQLLTLSTRPFGSTITARIEASNGPEAQRILVELGQDDTLKMWQVGTPVEVRDTPELPVYLPTPPYEEVDPT